MRFTEILLVATLVTGFVWILDLILWRPKRMALAGKKEGQESLAKEPIIVEYCRAFFPILLIVLILRSFLAEPFRIPSGSMRPTLLEGDFILVNKYEYGFRLPVTGQTLIKVNTPKRGDVIIFKHDKGKESMDMIKRVVGLPGDHIQYKHKTIYINGEPAQQKFISDMIDKNVGESQGWSVRHLVETLGDIQHDIFLQMTSVEPLVKEVVVPPDSYFVMGDNRDNSRDSRSWGFVKDPDILGRAMGVWMSWDSSQPWWKVNSCIRWERIGNGLHKPLDK
jgi:signal peptidase I